MAHTKKNWSRRSTHTSIIMQKIKCTYGSVFEKSYIKKPIFCDFCNFRPAQDFLVPQRIRQIIKHISFYYYAKNQKNLMKRF